MSSKKKTKKKKKKNKHTENIEKYQQVEVANNDTEELNGTNDLNSGVILS